MVFSDKVIKLGKANKILGLSKRNILTLFYSQDNNKVYVKKIKLNNKLSMSASSSYLNYSEIIPLTENIKVLRLNENIWIDKDD